MLTKGPLGKNFRGAVAPVAPVVPPPLITSVSHSGLHILSRTKQGVVLSTVNVSIFSQTPAQ